MRGVYVIALRAGREPNATCLRTTASPPIVPVVDNALLVIAIVNRGGRVQSAMKVLFI